MQLPSNLDNETFEVRIFNMQGQQVYSARQQHNQVQVQNLAGGCYHLQLQTEEKTYMTKMLIK